VDGVYKIGDDVSPPVATEEYDATFSDDARRQIRKAHIRKFHAVSLVGLTVNAEGRPENLCIVKPAGYGLDIQAMRTVERYRFNPAMRHGVPVAVRLSVEMDFKMY
jgi:protein TonB